MRKFTRSTQRCDGNIAGTGLAGAAPTATLAPYQDCTLIADTPRYSARDSGDRASIPETARDTTPPLSPATLSIRSGPHRAARDSLKVLNHLGLASETDETARKLGVHADTTPAILFQANGILLEAHQRRELSTDQTIAGLLQNLSRFGRNLSDPQARNLLRKFSLVAQVELHLSDLCNEVCQGCTFGFDLPIKPAPIMFPSHGLHVVAAMRPRALLLVGGGEPLLYKDRTTGQKFPEAVARLRDLLPDTQFGLISNGTVYPEGDWADQFTWVRLSVDAATPQTYKAFRGRPYFDRVCVNLLRLLRKTRVPRVGVGFVFCRGNIAEAPQAARFFFDLVSTYCPDTLPRFNIQYRPLRRDPKDAGRDDFPAPVTPEQIRQAEREFIALVEDKVFARFLYEQSNWEVIARGNTHREVPFHRCGYSTIFRLVRANGDIRPCCMRVAEAEPEFLMGNVLCDAPETIALNTLYNANFLRPGCDAAGCKLGNTNRLLEQGIAGELEAASDPDVASDPFFG